jgi:hypothetical protein
MFDTHFRLSARGILSSNGTLSGGTGEGFSYRLNMSAPLGGPFPEDMVDDMAADLVAFHGRPTSGIGAASVLTEVKLAKIGPDGLYRGDPAVRFVNQPGGGAGLRYPPQVALAVSLLTGIRGPSRRGRIFLPSPVWGLANDFLIAEADARGVATSVAQLIRDLNNAPGVDPLNFPNVVIASTKGFNTRVSAAQCGRVLDTIRSRRTSLDEKYPTEIEV